MASEIETIIERIETTGQLIGAWRPKIRNELKKRGYVVRRHEKGTYLIEKSGGQSATGPGHGPASIEEIIKAIETDGSVSGSWAPKLRKTLTEEGYLVLRKEKGIYTASKDHPLFADGKTSAMVEKKLPKAVESFYYDRGMELKQTVKYREGCGYPSDSWDPCQCSQCNRGERTRLGVLVEIVPFNRPEDEKVVPWAPAFDPVSGKDLE